MTVFSENDLQLLESKGISQEQVEEQIDTFKEGIPFVNLENAAVVSAGISEFSQDEEETLVDNFENARDSLALLKFVPASGAASRMFKALFNFLESFNPAKEDFEVYLERTNDKDTKAFFQGLEHFPFYRPIKNKISNKKELSDEDRLQFVKEMLLEDGLNFGFYPKGLLPFHHYDNHLVTPFEEHLKEASNYASVGDNAYLHLTISDQHRKLFSTEFNAIKDRIFNSTKMQFHLSYSYQKSSTDTVAVTLENELFRKSDGSLLFRPGGHGALIENLNEQDADIIFIKNIDNVVVPKYAGEIAQSKKVLAGLLLRVQQRAFHYAELLDNDLLADSGQMKEIKTFLEENLNIRFSERFYEFSLAEQIEVLKDKINRPIRICGMVKNEGEPGGGPFWIRDRQGHVSLQIVESAQVDISNPQQSAIFKNSTHFNPVDLVCGVKNYKGEKYHLLNFIDKKQGFITQKTQEGKPLKALELPGLWNGAMAFWNTIFVEVPLITFNPVKTVNDLLKPTHQGENA